MKNSARDEAIARIEADIISGVEGLDILPDNVAAMFAARKYLQSLDGGAAADAKPRRPRSDRGTKRKPGLPAGQVDGE
jgi:hypothetical protein